MEPMSEHHTSIDDQFLGEGATNPPTAAASPVDYTALLAQVAGDDELLRDVVQLFLDDCPPRLAAIEAAVEARDAEHIRTEAHGLKGAAGNLAASGLYDAARDLEVIGTEGRMDAADHAWRRLQAEAAAVLSCLRDLQQLSALNSPAA